jgi:hypothetical protein
MQHAFLAQAKNVFSHTLLQSPQLGPLAVSMRGLSLRIYPFIKALEISFPWKALSMAIYSFISELLFGTRAKIHRISDLKALHPWLVFLMIKFPIQVLQNK